MRNSQSWRKRCPSEHPTFQLSGASREGGIHLCQNLVSRFCSSGAYWEEKGKGRVLLLQSPAVQQADTRGSEGLWTPRGEGRTVSQGDSANTSTERLIHGNVRSQIPSQADKQGLLWKEARPYILGSVKVIAANSKCQGHKGAGMYSWRRKKVKICEWIFKK